MKHCNRCDQDKSLDSFGNNRSTKDGKQPYCKECTNKYARDWDKDNPLVRSEHYVKWYLQSKYGITPTEKEQLLSEQGGGCAICGSALEVGGQQTHVDHDHETGEVRGILCSSCNMALGLFKDNPDLLAAASRYLQK